MFTNSQLGTVHLLCGKVCSGKSTFARKLHEETHGIILSCDDLTLTLFNQQLGKNHDTILNRCKEYLYNLAIHIAKTKVDVILDFGFWTKFERDNIKMKFNSLDIPTKLHYIQIDDATQLKRIRQRNLHNDGYFIDDAILKKCNSQFEPPSIDELI